MKTILIFIDWFLPGYKAGGPIRSYANLLDHFKNEYTFYIVTRDTDYTETQPYKGITPNTWSRRDTNVHIWYCTAGFPSRSNFKKLITETPWDVLYINGIYSWKFSILPLLIARRHRKGKIIVSVRGMLRQSAVNVKQGKKKVFLQLAKTFGLYKGITLHATNDEEKQDIIENIGPKVTVHVAPNLPRKTNHEWQPREKKPGSLQLISVARIAPEKNTLYALEALYHFTNPSPSEASAKEGFNLQSHGEEPVRHRRRVRRRRDTEGVNFQPSAFSFQLFGSIYNQSYWADCQKIIQSLPSEITVTYHGPLGSEEVPKKLAQSHFLFMPTRGENYGHVILESLSAGCPVIISDQTPWRNLHKKGIGWDIALDNKEAFLEAIETCLSMDQQTYNHMSHTAYEFAQQVINNPSILEANRQLFA
jgi:glycosyltransferase involved in cell wall biosynthesis